MSERLKQPGSDRPVVDLRSDTVTRPTEGMRKAIAGAEVGDDVLGKDPTADRLERAVAERLGKQAALFFPSGTQANQTAILLQSRPGTEIVCEAESHVFHYELADAAFLSRAQLHPVASREGRITAAEYAAAIRPGDRHHPLTSLLCVENTHNMHGGVVVALEALREIRVLARERGLPVHLDGARLWNASAASGVPLAAYAECADTVMVSLSKGLGCPVGSVLAGSAQLIERAWTVRKRLGGGMRQVGILAAAGIYALEHHLAGLAEDHRRARRLAEACDQIEGLRAETPETNILMIHIEREDLAPESLSERLAERNIWILPAGSRRLRAVTHLGVDDRGIERAAAALREIVEG
ncbi:MAG: threonine aldolase family protein [Gemmatimonadota bacterium]